MWGISRTCIYALCDRGFCTLYIVWGLALTCPTSSFYQSNIRALDAPSSSLEVEPFKEIPSWVDQLEVDLASDGSDSGKVGRVPGESLDDHP
ncbi:hypothetical protein AHAS_Ahas09G0103900 [Arachis hypogaea]